MTERWAIRLTAVPDGGYRLRMTRPFLGHFLQSYDCDAHEGLGAAVWTADAAQALTFGSFDEARACWWAQSSVVPTVGGLIPGAERPVPSVVENRPLSICSVSIDPLP